MLVACLPAVLALVVGASSLEPSEAWLSSAPTGLDEAFSYVSQRVRYEPYPGVLRGAKGAAIAGAGNSWDKSLLLAELLRRGGYEVRFAEGELSPANAEVLLRGAYPPRLPERKLGPEFGPFTPAADPALKQATSTHVWVEVNQGRTWLPLDPSFPRAKPGEAYATRRSAFTRPPRDALQRISLVWKERGSGTRELASLELVAAEVGLIPVTLNVHGLALEQSAPETAASGGVTGLFGSALGGGAPEAREAPKPAANAGVAAVVLKRSVQIGDRVHEAASTVVKKGASARPDREWLELTLHVPGRVPQAFQRELVDASSDGFADENLLSLRRYSLGVFTGPVPLAALDEQFRRARELGVADAAKQLDGAKPDGPGTRKAEEVDRLVGPVPGHLLAVSHAQASDALSERLARNAGVVVVREKPRVLIASIETVGLDAKPRQTVSLDLRVDEVRALPFPGQAVRSAELFQRARGMMSSAVEGRVLSQVTGGEIATTSALMAKAQAERVPLVAVRTHQDVNKLHELTDRGSRLLNAIVQSGRHAIVPAKKLTLAGRERTGFWEVDPATGAVSGVMDDGLHQAMVQYQLELSQVGLNPHNGKIFGGMMGAITTTGLLSAKILEHGEVNTEVLKEIKKLGEGILCYACPKAEAKVGGKAALGEDCLKLEKMGEASAKVDFCEQYSDGFKCSMGMLLAAYADEGKTGLEPEVKFEKGAELACNKWPEGDGQ